MRKVVFEVVMNMILIIITMIFACQTVLTTNYTPEQGHSYAAPELGWGWYLFLIVGFLVLFARNYYAKKLGSKDGYNKEKGEFSSQDEREALISGNAAKTSSSIGAGILFIICAASIYVNTFLTTKISITITYIIIAGIGAAVTDLTYLFAWIYYDNKD